MNVDALVVTYNRKDKLMECLCNLMQMDLKNIFVIDNHSNKDTRDYLDQMKKNDKRLKVTHLKDNIGGAGGFNCGMKLFVKNSQSDFLWIMDDDTIPNIDSLNKLLHAYKSNEKVGFVSGSVYWTDGNLAKMNIPIYSDQPSSLDKNIKYIDEASFVAILFSREVIKQVGFPIKEFFIWGDDVEYTRRIKKSGYQGIQVVNAKIIHKMNSNNSTNIIKDNDNIGRISRYFYDFRNRVYLSRKQSLLAEIKTLVGRMVWALRIVFYHNEHKALKLKILWKGTVAGLSFNPQIEEAISLKDKIGD